MTVSDMSDWQGHDPRASDGMEALDDRRTQVGRTVVFSDRHGPYQFWREGAEVPCVCDPVSGLACKYHAAKLTEAERSTYDEINTAGSGEQPRWRPVKPGLTGRTRNAFWISERAFFDARSPSKIVSA
jgi:hypothetical protein